MQTECKLPASCSMKSETLPTSPNPSTRKPITWLSSRFTLSEQSNFQTGKKKKGKRVCYGFPFLSISTVAMATAMITAIPVPTIVIVLSGTAAAGGWGVVSGAGPTDRAVSAYELQYEPLPANVA